MVIRRVEFDLGQDAYGRKTTLAREVNYDGKVFWSVKIDAASQRDDVQTLSGLTTDQLQRLAEALVGVAKLDGANA